MERKGISSSEKTRETHKTIDLRIRVCRVRLLSKTNIETVQTLTVIGSFAVRTTTYPVLVLERFLGRIAESTEIISRLLRRNSG